MNRYVEGYTNNMNNRTKNEICNKCSCYSWACPAQWWDDDGQPMKWCNNELCEDTYVITGFCYQPKQED